MMMQPDIEQTVNSIKKFLVDKLDQSGLTGYVVGISGGIDSALSAKLAVEAVGREKVMGLILPYRTSSESSVKDALNLVDRFGIEYREIDISPMIDAYFPRIDVTNRLRAGNKMARERMAILFDIARELDRLVLGTGNRTEICLGYTTWYGDSACSVNPVGELYKTEVRMIAGFLGIPDYIVKKIPTADLWSGQTDEGEIGVTYDNIDRLLRRLIDDGVLSRSELKSEGFIVAEIDRVVSMLNKNSFKRRLPDVASLGRKAIPAQLNLRD